MILILAIDKKNLPLEGIVTSLDHKLRSLLSDQPSYRNRIKKVLILNFKKQIIKSSEFKNKSLINSIGGERGKNFAFNKEIFDLISNSVIINTNELSSSIFQNSKVVERINIANLVIDKIKDLIDSYKIIFIGDRINPGFAKILLSFNNLVGFYSRVTSGRTTYTKILYPKKYLEMILQLNQAAGKIFSSHSQDELSFLIELKRKLGKRNKKIFMYGSDKYISDMIVADLEKKRKYLKYDCSKGNFNIIANSPGYIFDNVHSLSQDDRRGLLNSLSTIPNKNYIILRSNTYLSDLSISNYTPIPIPTIEKILSDIPLIFYRILKAKSINKEINLNKKLWLRNLKSRAILPFYKSLKSLYELDFIIEKILSGSEKTINPGTREFWYELIYGEKLIKIRSQYLRGELETRILSNGSLSEFVKHFESSQIKSVDDVDEEYQNTIELNFTYDEKIDEDNWIVTCNLLDEPFTYSYDSIGIKTMAYLKEYPSCKKLDAVKLRKKFKDYYGKEYKSQRKKKKGPSDPYKNAFNAMRGAAKYDLEKIFKTLEDMDQIVKRILKRFRWSKFCFYTEKEDVNVILEFHDPALKNHPPTN